MNYRSTALIFLAAALFTAPEAVADIIGHNLTTPIGPGYSLVTVDPGPVNVPSRPGIVVALDPFACGANCGTSSLDRGNPANPKLADPGPVGHFSILWGMADPGPVNFVFDLPAAAPGANGDYAWSATESGPGQNQIANFQGVFHLVTSSPIVAASWVLADPGPISNSFEIDFSTTAPGSAALDFTLSENNTPLSFVATPEPSSLLLLGAGVLGAIGAARRKRLG